MAINNCINNTANVFTSTTTIGAGTGITCTLNDITASAGNFVATNGGLSLGRTSADATAPLAAFLKSRAGGIITSSDALGEVDFSGHDGVQYIVGSKITSTNVGTPGVDRIGSDLKFYTHRDTTDATKLRLTIDKDGAFTIAAPDAGTALTITNGGLTVTAGTVAFSALSWGAACFNATGQVSSQTPGAAGTILTSNGATSLPTFQAPPTGLIWSEATADVSPMVVGYGYIANKAGTACSLALPAASVVGSVIKIVGKGATGWIITQAANQKIIFGTAASTVGVTGTLASSATSDCIEMVCTTADLFWTVVNSVGNLTLA